MRVKMIKTNGCKLLLDALHTFHTTEAYSNLGLTKVKYKTYKHSREEKL
jgi:hypothetical protein